jgi:hypothetical protein
MSIEIIIFTQDVLVSREKWGGVSLYPEIPSNPEREGR